MAVNQCLQAGKIVLFESRKLARLVAPLLLPQQVPHHASRVLSPVRRFLRLLDVGRGPDNVGAQPISSIFACSKPSSSSICRVPSIFAGLGKHFAIGA